MVYMVTAVKDIYELNTGVEVAGIFDDAEKAYEAKLKIEEWLKNEGYKDYEVYVVRRKVNNLAWYEVDEDI